MRAFVYVGEKNSDEILLGETKYYAAVNEDPNDPTSKLTIKEVRVNASGKPIKPEGLAGGAFSENPIRVLSGGKSGVYWERKWASINSDGTISKGDLPSGMVRLIGRYWEAGKEYKVKLKATAGGRANTLEIKVVKPDRLGDKYGKARNVFDRVVDVDSLIIANAGKYGIPPQVIKAHISGEVYTKNFGGEIGEGFTPGYLYEPFTVEFWLRDKDNDYKLSKEWADNIFKVSKTSMGSGGAVPEHMHTEKQVYPTTPKTIWDLVSEYSSIEHASPPGEWNSYAKRKNGSTNELDFYNYNDPRRAYEAIIIEVRDKNKKLKEEEVFKKANDSLAVYLKTKWRGGLDSLYAQTRIAASYGYFQVLYTTGILPISSYGANYPKTKIPEKINETETNFQLDMEKYQYLLKKKKASNWDAGYEKVWFDLLSNWNAKTTYSTTIFEKIENFLPLAK